MVATRRSGRSLAAATGVALALFALPAAAVAPQAGWVQNSPLVPTTPATTPSGIYWLQLTRRIVPQVRVPGRMLLGHELYGLWESAGAGWTPLMPQCANGVAASEVSSITGMRECSVEGIALDESLSSGAATVYVTTFDVSVPGLGVQYGGVYKALLPASRDLTDVVWKPLLTGVRGNGLAVSHPAGKQVTIVAGRIQHNAGDVGGDANSWCAPAGCQPSVYVSHNDGATWSAIGFDTPLCSTAVGTSSRLVGAVAFDPANPSVVIAAANSGLWASSDNGTTWRYAFTSCGDSPGFAISPAGAVYVGQNTSSPSSGLYRAAETASGPGAFQPLSLRSAITNAPMSLPGWVQQIVLDARDRAGRTMFVSTWQNANSSGGGSGGVWKVVDKGDGTATVLDLSSSLMDPLSDCLGLGRCLDRLPYPTTFDPLWRPTLFLAQHPLASDLLYASSFGGGVFTRSDG